MIERIRAAVLAKGWLLDARFFSNRAMMVRFETEASQMHTLLVSLTTLQDLNFDRPSLQRCPGSSELACFRSAIHRPLCSPGASG